MKLFSRITAIHFAVVNTPTMPEFRVEGQSLVIKVL